MLQVSKIQRPRVLTVANIRRAMIAAVLLSVLWRVFSPVNAGSGPQNSPALPGEISFLQNTIDADAQTVAMSKTCKSKAVHPELISFCLDAIAKRSEEMQQLQLWLSAWYGNIRDPRLSPRGAQMLGEILTMSLDAYEIYYIEDITGQNQQVTAQASICAQTSSHPELVKACGEIVRQRTLENQRLKGWLCQWYGRCQAIASN